MLSLLLEVKKNFSLIIAMNFPIINYISRITIILQQTITSALRDVDQKTLTVLIVICSDRQTKKILRPTIDQCNDIIDENRAIVSCDVIVMIDEQLSMGLWEMKFEETFIGVDVVNFTNSD